jgi:hypothetical protein
MGDYPVGMRTRRGNGSHTKENGMVKMIDRIARRMDILAVVVLARSGLTRKEIARVLGTSEKSIERMLPFRQIRRK